jgi:hypothetical protein
LAQHHAAENVLQENHPQKVLFQTVHVPTVLPVTVLFPGENVLNVVGLTFLLQADYVATVLLALMCAMWRGWRLHHVSHVL